METQLRERRGRDGQITLERAFRAHVVGQSSETPFVRAPASTIDADAITTMIAAFRETYESSSGNRFEFVPVQGVTFRVRAVLDTPKVEYPVIPARGDEPLIRTGTTQLHYLGDLDEG